MSTREIQTVCFVGAGTMGCYNALIAAVSGYDVVLYDVVQNSLDQVAARHSEFGDLFLAAGYCSQNDIDGALARISTTTDLTEATANADLVSESVFEQLDLKRDIHRQLDQVCPPETIITTNSSKLMVSQIEDVYDKGNRIAALHTHLGSPLVDIVCGPRTDSAIADILERYVVSLGGTALLLKKEYPGYVLNAMLGAVLGAGLQLCASGRATAEQVDRAWMKNHNAPAGPFGMMDQFGLGIIVDDQHNSGDAIKERMRSEVLALLTPYIESGQLGAQAGSGFYEYPNPNYQAPEFLYSSEDEAEAYPLMLSALIGTAILIAAEGVLEPEGIDRAWKLGMHLDTGPFELLEKIGRSTFVQILEKEATANNFDPDKARKITAWIRDTL
jgi:enoyl-CoA hydratase/3-hydroxyacyl-CoA dehydrogenase